MGTIGQFSLVFAIAWIGVMAVDMKWNSFG